MSDSRRTDSGPTLLPSIGPVRTGCLCCAPKPATAPMDWYPHPGFGLLALTRDDETPDWWAEFADLVEWVYELGEGWKSVTVQAGPRKGQEFEHFEGDWWPRWIHEEVTLGEIEECVAEDPDHDWQLRIEGPMGGVVYQRHGCAQWVAIERLDGFA